MNFFCLYPSDKTYDTSGHPLEIVIEARHPIKVVIDAPGVNYN